MCPFHYITLFSVHQFWEGGRGFELDLRELKEGKTAAEAAGLSELADKYKAKIYQKQNEYQSFCKDCGLKTRFDKTRVYTPDSRIKSADMKSVDNFVKSDIIDKNDVDGVQDVHYVGKIDRDIYKKAANNKILTDDVIITDNRIQHIIERRGKEFYDEYKDYFSGIISNPDYVFKDKLNNTAMASKTFIHKNTTINIVVRLIVEGENRNYKNSIITAIKENDKRFKQRLRNNIPIYVGVDKLE